MPNKQSTLRENPWFFISFILLAGIIFFPPYFRGLFFPTEQIVTFMIALVAFVVAWVWKTGEGKITPFSTPMDYFALALVVAYLLAIIGAASYRLAVQGLIKITLFFLVYWLTGELAKKEPWSKIILAALYTTGVGVALAGLGAALGVLDIADGLMGDRISSTLQYPNSLAVYLLAISFIGFYFWATTNKWLQFALITGNYAILMAFLGTNSRGGLLIAAIMIPIFIIGLAKEHRIWVLLSFIFTGAGVLAGSFRFIPSIMAKDPGKAWLFLGLGLAIVLIGQGLLIFSRKILGAKKTIFTLLGLLVIVLIGGGIYIAGQEVVPNQIANPNEFHLYTNAEAAMTITEDGWNRVDVNKSGDYSWIARTGGYSVKPGETVTYSIEFKSDTGDLSPNLSGSIALGRLEQTSDITWTITWTNEDDEIRYEYIYFRHSGEPNAEINDAFYFKNPTVVVEGLTLTFWEKVIPEQLLTRIQSIMAGEGTSERIYWTGEAVKMIKTKPLLGYGGGGWEAAYRSQQAYNYSSTQVHNDWIQLGVETGLIGLLAWLGLWLLFIYEGFKIVITKGANRSLTWAVMSAAAAIGGHAIIDFDLSLGAVSIALWFSFGMIRSMVPEKTAQETKKALTRQQRKQGYKPKTNKAPLIIATAISATLFLGASSLLLGGNYGSKAVAAIQEGDGKTGLEYLLKASTFDPFEAAYNTDAGNLTKIFGDLEAGIKLMEKAAKKDSYNRQMYFNLAEAYWQRGDLEKSIKAAEKAKECAPLLQEVNNTLARMYALTGIRYLEEGNKDAAKEVFNKVMALPVEFEMYFDNLDEKTQEMWTPSNRLKIDGELALSLAIAEYFYGLYDEAETHLQLALKNDETKTEATLWQAVIKERRGKRGESWDLLAEVETQDEAIAQNYDVILSLPDLNDS